MNAELVRICDIAVGEHWIADPKKMLFCILTNVAAKDARRVEFDGVIPPSYLEATKLLYKVVGNSDAPELKAFYKVAGTNEEGYYDLAAEIVCGACLAYLETVMTPKELASFRAATPIRKFNRFMDDIFRMLHGEDSQ